MRRAKKMKRQIKNKKGVVLLIGVLLLLFLTLFVKQHSFFSHQTVIQVTKINTICLGKDKTPSQTSENRYEQKITAVVKDGAYKGRVVTFDHEYFASEVRTQKYRTGDYLYAELKQQADAELLVTPIGVKSDYYFVMLGGIFLIGLFFVSKKRGGMVLLSILINAFLCWGLVKTGTVNDFFSYTWGFLIVIFCVVTLFCAAGWHKKTLGAIISSLLTIGTVYLLYELTVKQSKAIPYDLMPYYAPNMPIEKIFQASVLFGCLGAIMDIAITIQAAVSELLLKKPLITTKELVQSIREISYDIMRTMTNVLLFSYLGSSLPLTVLQIANQYSLSVIFRYTFIFDVVRFLLGCIGIVLCIPISGVIAVMLLKRRAVRKA